MSLYVGSTVGIKLQKDISLYERKAKDYVQRLMVNAQSNLGQSDVSKGTAMLEVPDPIMFCMESQL